jgi:murein DD-endopeptidase MepM/ murein hydrolase activator NlpD
MVTREYSLGDHDEQGEVGVVHGIQYILSGHNKWGYRTFHAKRNGIFGESTGLATRKMKYKIGYAEKDLNKKFGPRLYDYLTHRRRRTPAMVLRAKARARVKATGFMFPLKYAKIFIGFPGQGTHSYTDPPNNWQSDHAWDLHCPNGTPVVACCDGVIGNRIGSLGGTGRFAGIRLYIEIPGNQFYYAHLSSVTVKAGQHVKKGQVIGHSGSANGVPHLHWAVEHGNPLNLPLR